MAALPDLAFIAILRRASRPLVQLHPRGVDREPQFCALPLEGTPWCCSVPQSRPRLSIFLEVPWRQRLKGTKAPCSLWAGWAKLMSLTPFRAA